MCVCFHAVNPVWSLSQHLAKIQRSVQSREQGLTFLGQHVETQVSVVLRLVVDLSVAVVTEHKRPVAVLILTVAVVTHLKKKHKSDDNKP